MLGPAGYEAIKMCLAISQAQSFFVCQYSLLCLPGPCPGPISAIFKVYHQAEAIQEKPRTFFTFLKV